MRLDTPDCWGAFVKSPLRATADERPRAGPGPSTSGCGSPCPSSRVCSVLSPKPASSCSDLRRMNQRLTNCEERERLVVGSCLAESTLLWELSVRSRSLGKGASFFTALREHVVFDFSAPLHLEKGYSGPRGENAKRNKT